MALHPLSYYTLQLALVRSKIGWLSIVAILSFLVAGGLHFYFSPMLHRNTLDAQGTLSTVRVQVASEASQMLSKKYAEFQSLLVPKRDRTQALKTLFKIASKAGVTLAQGEYRTVDVDSCNCQKLEITLPMRGTYLQIRNFVGGLLADMNATALEEISFRRGDVKIATLEAQLRLSLFFRGEN